ncbi:MAG: hypothetical protein H6Q69_14 [Firmicutes bacterium]|nr:hypothetical protein [Bacillota bacterium]
MEYLFSEIRFKDNFNVNNKRSADSIRLTHFADKSFKLFPYKATGKNSAPIVLDLTDILSQFFKLIMHVETEVIDYDSLCQKLIDRISVEETDRDVFKELIHDLFFRNGHFNASTIGLYCYQSQEENKSVNRLAKFLYDVMGLDNKDCVFIKNLIDHYTCNVIEQLVLDAVDMEVTNHQKNEEKYFTIVTNVQNGFKDDFKFMLKTGMTAAQDLENLLSLYYFFYMAQTCLTLGQFMNGDRKKSVPLYYALDWEKISMNRKCYSDGWQILQPSVSCMFCHAITLELLNQHTEFFMLDYIALKELIDNDQQKDEQLSKEVDKVRFAYQSCIGDYQKFDEIKRPNGFNKTDEAIRHLFASVQAQFLNTDRKRANQFYVEKFKAFCKERWLKNRKKAGLVLNLTERDIIFLTKLCIRDREKIRLNELFNAYEDRGIYLDNTSKGELQGFFTKLNLIDKKSDSGDAQYVKRIL